MAYRAMFEIDPSAVPLTFEAEFGNDVVIIGINYNELGDFYSADLFDDQGEPIILGEKLIYGKPLWRRYAGSKLPAVDLLPLDESGRTKVCNKETFGQTVFLYIDTVEDEDG